MEQYVAIAGRQTGPMQVIASPQAGNILLFWMSERGGSLA